MSLQYIREIVVACRDVAAATAFHQSAFDLQILDDAVDGDGVLLGVPGSPGGRLRLISADATDGAQSKEATPVWGVGPRLLGIYSHDLDHTAASMADAGGAPRTPVTYPYGASTLSELVGRGTDDVWWTIPLAKPGMHRPSHAYEADTDRMHSELHTAVLVVEDHDAAVGFFEAAGLHTLFDGEMSGAPFEELVGMPAGATLRLAFLVGADQLPARLEIMSFTGVPSSPPSDSAIGIKRLVFAADDLDATIHALRLAGARAVDDRVVIGPVGVEIEVAEL